MKYKIGTDVLLHDGTFGTVVDYDNNDQTYRIKLKNSMAYAWSKEPALSVPQIAKCQCGLTHTRHGGKHSPWCQLWAPDDAS